MTHQDLLSAIKTKLSEIEAQVRISNLNAEFDINNHLEDLMIPLLNLIFEGDFKNVNYEQKNYPGIDLWDKNTGIAFQVTSTVDLEKIQDALRKAQAQDKIKITEFYFLMLQPKKRNFQSKTAAAISSIINDRYKFDLHSNIIDLADVYRLLKQRNEYLVLANALDILQKSFGAIKISDRLPYDVFQKFKADYFKACLTNFSRINFYGLSVTFKPREILLNRLFVEPKYEVSSFAGTNTFDDKAFELSEFVSTYESKGGDAAMELMEQEEELIKMLPDMTDSAPDGNASFFSTLMNGTRNFVILGNAGSGKSSLIKYAICKIIEKDYVVFQNRNIYLFIPFRIELHKFNRYRKSKAKGIISYLHYLLESEFQCRVAPESLEAIIDRFPTLFFFDGLDEIFDVQERLDMRNAIESFAYQNKRCRVVISSRYESYEEVNFTASLVSVYKLKNFSSLEIGSYVQKWYEIESEKDRSDQAEIDECLRQLQTVEEELKTNPLLLSLILILYRSSAGIPTSRLAIYENCTKTIVDTRDENEKKLDISLLIKNKASVFSALANWQFYQEQEDKPFASYPTVKTFIKNHLLSRLNFEDEQTADRAATEFLNFSKVRSIFLENHFTHKTFFEYYTAYYLYGDVYQKPERREEFFALFSRNMGNASWAVVLELLICKVDSVQTDNEVIDRIVREQLDSGKEPGIAFCIYLSRYLSNISLGLLRRLTITGIDNCLLHSEGTGPAGDTGMLFFNALVGMDKNAIVREMLLVSLKERLEVARDGQLVLLSVFLFEYAIASRENAFAELMSDRAPSHPYLFLLGHHQQIRGFENYFDLAGTFDRLFPQEINRRFYSKFRQKVFFSTRFDWVMSYYLFDTDSSHRERYKRLLSHFGMAGLMKNAGLENGFDDVEMDPLVNEYYRYRHADYEYKLFLSRFLEQSKKMKSKR